MDTGTMPTKSIDSTTKEDPSHTNHVKKLRKLKIEENLISKSICKTSEEFSEEYCNPENNYPEIKRFSNKLRSDFIQIRDLFEEVKINTVSLDNLQSLDIDDVKKTVLNLESKIQEFKTSLQNQLKLLKSKEMDLINQVDEISNDRKNVRKLKKVQIKVFAEIVPSPIKFLINSPFKCPEVQEFQEFLANSNRYGGWIPYNHDIFKKEWHKYFGTQKNIEDFEYQDVNVENSEFFQQFLNRVCGKIPGIRIEEIMKHNKWYTKYIYLKERQQRALEEWRQKKRLIQSARQSIAKGHQINKNNELEKSIDKSFVEDDEDDLNTRPSNNLKKQEDEKCQHNFKDSLSLDVSLEDIDIISEPVVTVPCAYKPSAKQLSTYRNPTKQWNYRCNDVIEENKCINGVDNILKRRVPDWRLVLQAD